MSDDQPAKPVRRIRKVETVREKAEKAAEQKPITRRRQLWRGFTAPLRALGRGLRWFNRFKIVRFFGLIIVPRYFRNSWRELRQTTWPSRRESRQLTTAVVLFAVVFGLLIAVVDYGLDKVFKQVLLK